MTGLKGLFVGRHADLAFLRVNFEEVRAGHPRRVLIQGQAGIGKTALAHRFLAESRGLLGSLQSRGPVVIVIDDVQWADQPSLRFRRSFPRRPGRAPNAIFRPSLLRIFRHEASLI